MTIKEFIEKYEIQAPQIEGLRNAAKYWASNDFDERLLVLIYIREFGMYPGGLDNPPTEYIPISVEDLINFFYLDILDMGTWE